MRTRSVIRNTAFNKHGAASGCPRHVAHTSHPARPPPVGRCYLGRRGIFKRSFWLLHGEKIDYGSTYQLTIQFGDSKATKGKKTCICDSMSRDVNCKVGLLWGKVVLHQQSGQNCTRRRLSKESRSNFKSLSIQSVISFLPVSRWSSMDVGHDINNTVACAI